MNFKELRSSQKVKQIKVSEDLKINKSRVSQWESGIRQPKLDQLPLIAEALNCSIEEVVLALIETRNQIKEVANA